MPLLPYAVLLVVRGRLALAMATIAVARKKVTARAGSGRDGDYKEGGAVCLLRSITRSGMACRRRCRRGDGMDDQVGSPPPWPAAPAGSAQPEGLSGVLDHEQVPGADDAAQSAARLRGDRELWDVLAAEAFAGPAYAAFEEQIASTAAALGAVSLAKVPGVADLILLRDGRA